VRPKAYPPLRTRRAATVDAIGAIRCTCLLGARHLFPGSLWNFVRMPECQTPLSILLNPGVRVTPSQGPAFIRSTRRGDNSLISHHDDHVPVKKEPLWSTLKPRIPNHAVVNQFQKLGLLLDNPIRRMVDSMVIRKQLLQSGLVATRRRTGPAHSHGPG